MSVLLWDRHYKPYLAYGVTKAWKVYKTFHNGKKKIYVLINQYKFLPGETSFSWEYNLLRPFRVVTKHLEHEYEWNSV